MSRPPRCKKKRGWDGENGSGEGYGLKKKKDASLGPGLGDLGGDRQGERRGGE